MLGTYLPWRDVLHEGPIPPGTLQEVTLVRGQYLGKMFGNGIKTVYEMQKRDEVIARCAQFDEIVLWFEHDLYDQLQLLQILDFLGTQRLASGRVQLIQSDDFLGLLSPEELLALQGKRRPVNAAMYTRASAVWNALRETTPLALFEIARSRTPELKHVGAALLRLFEEFPSSRSGLGRTQTQIVQTVTEGSSRRDDIFRLAQAQEEAVYLGDTVFFSYLEELCNSPAPLLMHFDGGFAATPLAHQVLRGDVDWLAQHPIDRFIGGVHLHGAQVWRWEGALKEFIAP